ncbi:MAG: hypothetical protein GZ089_03680 [Aromatoleum sp.]|nr:hypothetical protein [Aromatoleum sp.]
MHAPSENAPFRPLWVAAIAALLIGVVGTAISMVGNSTASPGEAGLRVTLRSPPPSVVDAPAATAGGRRNQRACAECGVIESMRVVGMLDAEDVIPQSESMQLAAGGNDRGRRETTIGRYEYVVRLRDGSRHVLAETTPRDWVPGARINLIAGAADVRR